MSDTPKASATPPAKPGASDSNQGMFMGVRVDPTKGPGNPTASQARRPATTPKPRAHLRSREGESATTVVVTDIQMPFWSMVVFMVKWAVATIPAMIILGIIGGLFGGIMWGFVTEGVQQQQARELQRIQEEREAAIQEAIAEETARILLGE